MFVRGGSKRNAVTACACIRLGGHVRPRRSRSCHCCRSCSGVIGAAREVPLAPDLIRLILLISLTTMEGPAASKSDLIGTLLRCQHYNRRLLIEAKWTLAPCILRSPRKDAHAGLWRRFHSTVLRGLPRGDHARACAPDPSGPAPYW